MLRSAFSEDSAQPVVSALFYKRYLFVCVKPFSIVAFYLLHTTRRPGAKDTTPSTFSEPALLLPPHKKLSSFNHMNRIVKYSPAKVSSIVSF